MKKNEINNIQIIIGKEKKIVYRLGHTHCTHYDSIISYRLQGIVFSSFKLLIFDFQLKENVCYGTC